MSLILKVLDAPREEELGKNPIDRKRTYTFYNGIENPQVEHLADADGKHVVSVIWNLKDPQAGYMCIRIPSIAFLMENGQTIEVLRSE